VLAPIAMCEVENNHDSSHNFIGGAQKTNIHKTSSDAKSAGANAPAITGLNCAGYGSSVCVTATFGFVTVGLVLQELLG
jgi:tRNA A37 threonylcarbamoyladenosine dehydratase